MTDLSVYSLLERSKAIQTLITIYDDPGKSKTAYATQSGMVDRTVLWRIDELTEAGLVETVSDGRHNSVHPTGNGRMVAHNLSSLEFYLCSDTPTPICDDALPSIGTIGWAVDRMEHGARVFRRGWNGKGMYIKLKPASTLSDMTEPYIYIRTATGETVPWLCSQTDMLAEDWEEMDETI